MQIKRTEVGWKPPQTLPCPECSSRNSSGCVTGHSDGASEALVACQQWCNVAQGKHQQGGWLNVPSQGLTGPVLT